MPTRRRSSFNWRRGRSALLMTLGFAYVAKLVSSGVSVDVFPNMMARLKELPLVAQTAIQLQRVPPVGLFGHASETKAFVKMFPITRRLKSDPGNEIANRGVRLDRQAARHQFPSAVYKA